MTKRKKIKEIIVLSEELQHIIHGYIASDGYVKPGGSLTVEQSAAQAKFVDWLYDKLKPVRSDKEITNVTRTDKRSGKQTYSRRFYTKSVLKEFHKMWYAPYINKKGKTAYKKFLPKNLGDFFSATFITVWFAGDGGKTQDASGAKFEVTCFTPDERLVLQQLLLDKHEISTVINRAGTNKHKTEQWTINVKAEQYPKFKALITQMDLIQNVFPHKLCADKP